MSTMNSHACARARARGAFNLFMLKAHASVELALMHASSMFAQNGPSKAHAAKMYLGLGQCHH